MFEKDYSSKGKQGVEEEGKTWAGETVWQIGPKVKCTGLERKERMREVLNKHFKIQETEGRDLQIW